MGTLVPFATFVFICVLSTFLQETWLNGEGLLEAFDTVINSLPKSILAGKTAEFIIKRGVDMIKYLTDYLITQNQFTMKNKAPDEAKDHSEWVELEHP